MVVEWEFDGVVRLKPLMTAYMTPFIFPPRGSNPSLSRMHIESRDPFLIGNSFRLVTKFNKIFRSLATGKIQRNVAKATVFFKLPLYETILEVEKALRNNPEGYLLALKFEFKGR